MSITSGSLLFRLRRADDHAAWSRFVHLYTPVLNGWALKLGVPPGEVPDLLQEVFLVLVRVLPEFRPDPSLRFRGWLWTVTRNKFLEQRRRRQVATVAYPHPEGMPAEDEPPAEDEAERRLLVQRALDLVREDFQETTWEAFRKFAMEDRPAGEVARELNVSENAIYLARGRVLRRLREELEGMLEEA